MSLKICTSLILPIFRGNDSRGKCGWQERRNTISVGVQPAPIPPPEKKCRLGLFC